MNVINETHFYDLSEIIQNYQYLKKITVIPEFICKNAHECSCVDKTYKAVFKCIDRDQGYNLMCPHTNFGEGEFDATQVIRNSLELLEQQSKLKEEVRRRVETFFTVRRRADDIHGGHIRKELSFVDRDHGNDLQMSESLWIMRSNKLNTDEYQEAQKEIKEWMFIEAQWIQKTITKEVGKVLYDQLECEAKIEGPRYYDCV